VNTLDDFKVLLEETDIKQKYIVTKNTKIINNFLDLNNLENVVVLETSLNNLKSFSWEKPHLTSSYQGEENKMVQSGIVICDDNISRIFVKRRVKRSLSENLDLALQIKK
jgi:hypothetical protein